MATQKANSPLLGYNTNVRHDGHLFHIQTEDSGVSHPHVITHLFTEGTILATRKTPYDHLLEALDREDKIRELMKDQHKAMFVELRDGIHDETIRTILGKPAPAPPSTQIDVGPGTSALQQTARRPGTVSDSAPIKIVAVMPPREDETGVRVVRPAGMVAKEKPAAQAKQAESSLPRGRSIFSAPDAGGDFGEDLISDKSLDEVILSYLKDELGE
ncbi:MAG: hypothetical protein PHU25_03165 [Deltaproteobacteria bacterium]|nr:hypothetical protein [Deltaproteobacteria bacterium]